MLTLYRRHLAKCAHRAQGRAWQRATRKLAALEAPAAPQCKPFGFYAGEDAASSVAARLRHGADDGGLRATKTGAHCGSEQKVCRRARLGSTLIP